MVEKKKLRCCLSIYLFIVCFNNNLWCQSQKATIQFVSISFSEITDMALKGYVSLFAKSQLAKAFNPIGINKLNLLEAKVYCYDTILIFDRSNIISNDFSVSVKIDSFKLQKDKTTIKNKETIEINNGLTWGAKKTPNKKIHSINYCDYACKKADINLPYEVIGDIYEPDLCLSLKKNWLGKTKCKSCIRVFKAENWLFIYLQGGVVENRYEVIWIIKGNEYYGRIIDKLPLVDSMYKTN